MKLSCLIATILALYPMTQNDEHRHHFLKCFNIIMFYHKKKGARSNLSGSILQEKDKMLAFHLKFWHPNSSMI